MNTKFGTLIRESPPVKRVLRHKILTDSVRSNRLLFPEAGTDRFFKLVVKLSGISTGADYVSLLIKDEATGKLVIKAKRGNGKPAWERIWQQMIKIGKPILLDEATPNYPRLHRLMAEAGITAALYIPLAIKGDVIGAINHFKVAKKARFTPDELSFASILGWWSSLILENTRLSGSLQRQRLHIDKLLREICLAQENERKRLAVEIHDGVAQWLIGATYDIESCRALISESRFTELAPELVRVREVLQRSIKELRRAISDLRPVPLEKVGLVAAIQQAAEVLNEEDIRCHIQIDGRLPRLTSAEENTTYWIVQEVLTNIRRHSKASEASLCMRFRDDTVSAEISDNGQGFNPSEVMKSKIPLEHIGLLGMKERAKLLGGHLSVNSSSGKGTSIYFTFPVSSQIALKEKTKV